MGRTAIRGTAMGVILVGFLSGCSSRDWKTTDEIHVMSESVSPDGQYVVTVFSCAGGGAAGYTYTNVSLRPVSEPFNQREFLLGEHLWHSFTNISATWENESNLTVAYRWTTSHPDHRTQNGRTVSRIGDVKVTYLLENPG